MFDDARPARTFAEIWVATYDPTRLVCARCNRETLSRNVACYTRTRPGDPFDPWCHLCFHELVRWAGQGALVDQAFDTEDAAETITELLTNGRD